MSTLMTSAVAAVWLAALGPLDASAQNPSSPSSFQSALRSREPAPLFASREPLVITLDVEIPALLDDKDDKDEQKADHRANLTYVDGAGAPVAMRLKLRTRGNYRLKHCKFPPLRFDFPKDSVGGTVFAGQNKLKVVTHCQTGQEYEQYVLHEHAIYRIYNILSELSLRVRLARITYQDTSGKEKPITRYAFFIEDIDDLAARAGMAVTDTMNVHPASTELRHTGVLDVFQYLIGNTDWSTYARHNIDLLRADDGTLFALPYDFDWTGLVNARYARPDPQLGIRSVRERLYRGFCRPPQYVEAALQPFREQREAIYAVFDSLPDLDPKRLERTREYLDDFYEMLDDPKAVDREFVKQCRTQ